MIRIELTHYLDGFELRTEVEGEFETTEHVQRCDDVFDAFRQILRLRMEFFKGELSLKTCRSFMPDHESDVS